MEGENKATEIFFTRKDTTENGIVVGHKKRKSANEAEILPKPKTIKLGSQSENLSKNVTIEKISDATSTTSDTGSKLPEKGLKISDTVKESVKDVKKIDEYVCNSFQPTRV